MSSSFFTSPYIRLLGRHSRSRRVHNTPSRRIHDRYRHEFVFNQAASRCLAWLILTQLAVTITFVSELATHGDDIVWIFFFNPIAMIGWIGINWNLMAAGVFTRHADKIDRHLLAGIAMGLIPLTFTFGFTDCVSSGLAWGAKSATFIVTLVRIITLFPVVWIWAILREYQLAHGRHIDNVWIALATARAAELETIKSVVPSSVSENDMTVSEWMTDAKLLAFSKSFMIGSY